MGTHTGIAAIGHRSESWSDRLGRARPDAPLVLPLMVYMVFLGLTYAVPITAQPAMIAIRGLASLSVVFLFRKHLPPLGRPFGLVAIAAGVFAAWGWVVGQLYFERIGLGGRLPVIPGERMVVDPRGTLGASDLFWITWWMRMLGAVIAVPVVEELFWRGFLLRALIDWHNFERVPLGQFAWKAFIGTALISTLQHPDNWGVSIICWLGFNLLFYWTRSLLCLILVHSFTNLYLYLMSTRVGDWAFW